MYLLYMSVGAALLCFLVLIVLKFFFISKMRLDNRDKKVSSFLQFKTVKIIPVGMCLNLTRTVLQLNKPLTQSPQCVE